jgi:hypothetical protein
MLVGDDGVTVYHANWSVTMLRVLHSMKLSPNWLLSSAVFFAPLFLFQH